MKNLEKPVLPTTIPATPFYFYDEKTLRTLAEDFQKSIDQDDGIILHYAMKANNNPSILKILKEYECGLDTVSGEELLLAAECGYSGEKVVYSGVGKNESELKLAIEHEIGMIIVESREEYEELCVLAAQSNKKVKIGLRFNPNLSVDTHPYIATGLWEHKFGIDKAEVLKIIDLKRPANIEFVGLSLHLGSQIFEDKIFYDAVEEVVKLANEIKKKGVTFPVLNVGGGLGVNYETPYEKPDFDKYGKFLKWALLKWRETNPELNCKVYSECGRALIAQAGYLVTKVVRVKRNPKKNFAIVDASMTELLRPALYGAFHSVEKLNSSSNEKEKYDVVGPVCESGDFLARGREIEKLQKGDLLWVTCAGAYGFVLSNSYNLRALPAEYLLDTKGALLVLHLPIKTWKNVDETKS